jgi:hypothetical protein
MREYSGHLYILTARDSREAAAVLAMRDRVQEHLVDSQPSLSAAVARRRAERALVGLTLRRDGHQEQHIARVLRCDVRTVRRDQDLLRAANAAAISMRERRWTCAGCGTVAHGDLPGAWASDARVQACAGATAVRCSACAAALDDALAAGAEISFGRMSDLAVTRR